MKFTLIDHQFTLFDYNQMRPTCKIPIRRISRKRMEQVMKMRQKGNDAPLVNMLSDINDSLSRFEQRLTNKKYGIQKR